MQPRWLCGFQGIGQICGALILAANAVASGSADYVVMHRAMYNPPGSYHTNPMTRAEGAAQWTAPHGYWGPPAHMAFAYMEYMQRYGARREDLGKIVVQAREAGSELPWSHWYLIDLGHVDAEHRRGRRILGRADVAASSQALPRISATGS